MWKRHQHSELDKVYIRTVSWKIFPFKRLRFLSLFGAVVLLLNFIVIYLYFNDLGGGASFFFWIFIPPLVLDVVVSIKITEYLIARFLKENIQGIPVDAIEKAVDFYFNRDVDDATLSLLKSYALVYEVKNNKFVPCVWLGSIYSDGGGNIIKEYIDGRTAKL